MRVFQLRQIPLGQVWASLITKIPWDIQSVQNADCRLQTADCRVGTKCRLGTKCRMQTADCRLSTKCRLRRKTVFFFFLTNMITYVLSRNHCSKAIFHGNSGNLCLFLKWAKNIIYIQVEIPTPLQVMQLR